MTSLLHGKRVLLLEDNAVISMELEHRLSALGATSVACCATVAEAARIADREIIDLALCDVNVRDGSSLALVEQLQARGIPCALITGYSDLPERSGRLEAVPMLRKPVAPRDFTQLLTELLGVDRSSR